MIDLKVGSTVIVANDLDDCWDNASHLIGVQVKVMALFDGLGMEDGKPIPMVAISDKSGSSCCFRADMCKAADQRPWLKDLPDADLFCGSVWKLLYDTEMGKWCYSGGDANEWTLITGIRMPHVEDGGAAITIPELRAWQLANKEQSE